MRIRPLQVYLCVAAPLWCASIAARGQQPTPPGKGYLGIYAQSNSNVLDASNAFAGITVTRVVENSPGEAAGVKEKDVILQANGQDLKEANQLVGLAESLPVGSEIALRVERDQEILELKARTIARVEPGAGEDKAAPKTWTESRRLGFEFRAPGEEAAARLKLAPRQGIEVVRISPKGPMAKGKIAPGEVVIAADGEPILSPEAFLADVAARAEGSSIKLKIGGADGKARSEKVRLHAPPRKARKINLFPLLLYKREPTSTTLSIPLLLFKRESLTGAAKYTWLFFIKFETGSSEELLEVEPM